MESPDPETANSSLIEHFDALAELPVRHGFVGRMPGIDVQVERAHALERLDGCHRQARRLLNLGARRFATAEQVHGDRVAVLAGGEPLPDSPAMGADALATDRTDVCLGIYVADCCPVYLVDPVRRVIALVHSGKKGTELNITAAAVETLRARFGTDARDVVAQLGPCIRPPWYEVDIAALIVEQCRALGLRQVADCGACTAADPARYYSYRREKGRTGRMLALLALR